MALETVDFLPAKQYSYEKLRYALQQMGIKQGVVEPTDLEVLPKESGANMTVDIQKGNAWVQGKGAPEGMYHLYKTTRENQGTTIVAPSTNNRIDQIFLIINNAANAGVPQLAYLKGASEKAGAQISNVNGAKYLEGAGTTAELEALYPSCVGYMRLAYILVEKTTSAINAANILDARTWSAPKPLVLTQHGTSFPASSGELIRCGGAITVTLPSPVLNALVGILANNYAVVVSGSAGALIYGDFITGSSSINLGGYQHVLLQSDGTNWFITAGETSPGKITDGTHTLRMQTGVTSITVNASEGFKTMTITLPFTYPTAHVSFVASWQGASTNATESPLGACFPLSTSQANIITNGTAGVKSQTYDIFWISTGY